LKLYVNREFIPSEDSEVESIKVSGLRARPNKNWGSSLASYLRIGFSVLWKAVGIFLLGNSYAIEDLILISRGLPIALIRLSDLLIWPRLLVRLVKFGAVI